MLFRSMLDLASQSASPQDALLASRERINSISLVHEQLYQSSTIAELDFTEYAKGGEAKNWIAGAVKNPGALRSQLGVKEGQNIPAGKLAKAASAPGKLGQRARLAQTLSKLGK